MEWRRITALLMARARRRDRPAAAPQSRRRVRGSHAEALQRSRRVRPAGGAAKAQDSGSSTRQRKAAAASSDEEKPAKTRGRGRARSEKLRIIPLGGLHEVGKNITAYECGADIIIVDCGSAFPEEDMLGIDLVVPDMNYIFRNRKKVRGVFITHGHEDHIGSLPYLLRELNAPIFATPFARGPY